MKNLPLAVVYLTTALLPSVSGQGPTIRVVNSGSYLSDDLSPGTKITITGSNLSGIVQAAPDLQNPFTVLAGVSVKIGTVPVGLLYVSPTYITGIIDPSTPPGAA